MIRTLVILLLLKLTRSGSSSPSLASKTGLEVTTKANAMVLVVGDTVNITFNLNLRRGGTGLIGIDKPRLVFSADKPNKLEAVPGDEIIDLPEEDSCPITSHSDTKTFEVLTNFTVSVKVVKAGRCVIKLMAVPNVIDTSAAFMELSIKKSRSIEFFIIAIGWIYFFLWSVSFYPQILENYWRKSVVGLNIDFVILNVLGFLLYSCFNINLLFNQAVQAEYISLHPGGAIPVELNDVMFSCHATLAASITLAQCFTLDRANQTISSPCKASLVIMVGTVVVVVFLATWGTMTWLECLYILSYIKLVITLVKYIPQAVMNYRHKSTKGWSIGNILLDLLGGLFSLMQMVMIAYNSTDWTSLTGDPTKLGLAALSMAFDAFFMLQHYVLYRNKEPYVEID